MKRGAWPVKMCLWLLIAAVAGLTGGTVPAAAAVSEDIPGVIQQVSPSVVAIIGKPGELDGKPANRFDLAHGTGVVVKSNGYIVTNAHVVKDMTHIVVVTSDGKSYSGKTTHFDEESDLALVKIAADGLRQATFASPSDIKVGETVVAIGTPISFALRNSVTVGIVSGLERAVNSKYQLLQTDAAINPGNSGGALVNMRGQVVGINTMKFIDDSIDSLGFAIPVDTVQYVLDHFYKYGKVMRPYLGLELEESWEAVVGLPTQEELRVAYVDPDSPAAKAGIKQGDQLVSFDGSKVKTLVEFNELMKHYLPKQTVQVTLKSGGQTVTRDVTLGEDESGSSEWAQSPDGDSIDSDRGKTKIGDSHFGWSMKYPAGLIKAQQSDDGDMVTFADSKGEFALIVAVEEKQSEDMSHAGLLRKIAGKTNDTVLEKRYVEQGEHSYAKVVAKTDEDAYYQVRAFLKGDKIYYMTFYVENGENYKNGLKQNTYLDLLGSFRLSFDAKDDELKDISVFKSGDEFYTTGYGLAFELPSDWRESEYGDSLTYWNEDGNVHMRVGVTSASSGDTLEKWTERKEKQFADSYAESYRTVSGWNDLQLGDSLAAKENRFSWTFGDEWESRHSIYFIKDKYKYEIDIQFPKEEEGEELEQLIGKFISSFSFPKEEIHLGLGFIQDEEEWLDPDRTVTIRNEKYKYSVKVPETWETMFGYYGEESAELTYTFTGGKFEIEAAERGTLEQSIKNLELSYKKSSENDSEFQYNSADETVFGLDGKKFEVAYKKKDRPYEETVYLFTKGNIVYTVSMRLDDAAHTESNAERLRQAFQSIVLD